MRGLMALLAAVLAAGCFTPTPLPNRSANQVGCPIDGSASDFHAPELLLVANGKSGSVTVIDTARATAICELGVIPDIVERSREWSVIHRFVNWYAEYRFADDLAISPDRRVLYVSRGSLADVAAFAFPSGRLLWRIPIDGYRADHMALSRDGRHLFVSAIAAARVEVIDTQQRVIVAKIQTGARPHVIQLSDDDCYLFVGEMKGKSITVIDAKTFERMRTIRFAEAVRPFALAHDGHTLFVQLSRFHGFVEYDLRTDRISKRVLLPETERSRSYHGRYPKDAAHHGIVLSPDEKRLRIADTASNYVAMVSLPAFDVEALVDVGEQPGWAINSLDGRSCYVSSRGANTVSAISYDTKRETTRIAVGDYPQRMIAVSWWP